MMSQSIVASKTAKIYEAVEVLLDSVNAAVEDRIPLHKFEKSILQQVLKIGGHAVQMVFDKLGHGDLGAQLQLPDGSTLKRSEELKQREYVSPFGAFSVERYVYAQREGQKAQLIPVDARLALPESKFSYLLQDFDQHLAMEEPFAKVAGSIERILDISQHVDNLERGNRKMAEHVEAFHSQQQPPPPEEEGEILVETADGKGVPIRRPADAPRIEEHQARSGPKPDRKKIATVASVYSVDRHPRTAEEVVEALFRRPGERNPDKPDRPKPNHKRVRASLNHVDADGEPINGRAAMFGWMSDQVAARQQDQDQPVVCIMDGEQSLWEAIDLFQDAGQRIEILDLLHVTPRLWKAAHLFCDDQQQAASFVRERLTRLLQGGVDGMIRGLRRMASCRLRGKSRRTVETICQYFENNRERMHYDVYLAEGYPIASGVIEGACRHVVKDRMERSGMNWVIPGAQSMLSLRTIYLSDAWDEFMEWYSESETSRLHPHRSTLATLEWHTAA